MPHFPLRLTAALLHAAIVVGQQSSQTVNLAGIISEAAGIASAFGTPSPASSTASLTSSGTSAASTSASTTSSSISTPSSTAASSTASLASASATAEPTSDPITPQARTIIIAVSVVGGLLILGLLIGLALCCCLRRRRRRRRLANTETREIGGNDWVHGDTSHHGYVSSHSDIDRQPRIPEVAQHDSAPLMSEVTEEPAAASVVHPAYRTHSWDGKNVNERNPFTPNPPITRKPVPNGLNNRKSHPFMAAGAGAAVGAAAMHHHENKKREERDSGNSQSASSTYTSQSGPLIDEADRGRDFRDPNRPPTPFGLNAFGTSTKRSSRAGAIEPSLSAYEHERSSGHFIEHPTEAQRRSLSEREMAAANPPVPERSPKRSSFGSRGHAINPDDTPRTAYQDYNRNGNETDTSNESWQSAEATHTVAPPPPQQQAPSRPYWDDGNPYYAEPRHSGDHAFTNVPLMAPNATWAGHRNNNDGSSWRTSYEPFRRYGADGSPRRSIGADGKPRRLRFSDLSPEEYHYNYEPMHNVGQAL